MPAFGERLRELRQKAGLTQEQLAAQSGLSVWNIRNYEQSHREPYWSVVPRLAAALGVDCRAFTGQSGVQAEKQASAPRGKKAGAPRGPRQGRRK
jgi:transcriptional regulator with XRE-family HTH domain